MGLQWQERLVLLKYLVKQKKYDLLDGQQILPLANGGFEYFVTNPK